MEKAETRAVLMGLAELYPSSFSKHTDEGTWFVLEMWHDILKDEDARLVKAAVRACVSDNDTNFAPPIGQIRAKMKELAGVGGTTAEQAWETARSFWSNIGSDNAWEIEEEWRQLPEEIRRIYTPADMVELGFHTSSRDITTFEKPKFMKRYEEIRQQKLSLDLQTKSITQLAYEQNGVLMLADKQERKELTYGPDGSQPA
jgi:hypothetical protein